MASDKKTTLLKNATPTCCHLLIIYFCSKSFLIKY